jgi:hypothetical protein
VCSACVALCLLQVEAIRQGGMAAQQALNAKPFLSKGGPRLVEILVMGDLVRRHCTMSPVTSRHIPRPLVSPMLIPCCCGLLRCKQVRRNRRTSVFMKNDIEGSANTVAALIEDALAGKLNKGQWQARVAKLIVGGETRGAHFKQLLAAETLRCVDTLSRMHARAPHRPPTPLCHSPSHSSSTPIRCVGFSARELLDADFTAKELKVGGYSAEKMRKVRFRHGPHSRAPHTSCALRTV